MRKADRRDYVGMISLIVMGILILCTATCVATIGFCIPTYIVCALYALCNITFVISLEFSNCKWLLAFITFEFVQLLAIAIGLLLRAIIK